MSYKFWQFGSFTAVGAGLTAATVWGLPLAVARYPAMEWLHQLLFRTPIQYVTLSIFFFAAAVLAHRAFRQLTLAGSGPLLARRRADVRQRLEREGPSAAAAYHQEMTRREIQEVEGVYQLIGGAAQLILAVGLFGTVWGVRQQMFAAAPASLASVASTEHLKALLASFTSALGTALDTMVLGLACSLVVTVLMVVLERFELGAVDSLAVAVKNELGLRETGPSGEPRLLEDLEVRLSAIAQPLLQQTEAALATMVARSVETLEAKLEATLRAYITALDAQDARTASVLAREIREAAADVGKTLEAQGDRARGVLSDELRRVTEQLHRRPEVVIRYPGAESLNGAVHEERIER